MVVARHTSNALQNSNRKVKSFRVLPVFIASIRPRHTSLAEWIILPKVPTKQPELRRVLEIYNGRQLLRTERLEEHPEVPELFAWYVENQWNPWAAAEALRLQTIKHYNELFSIQQTIATEGSETQLGMVWGLGFAVWKRKGQGLHCVIR